MKHKYMYSVHFYKVLYGSIYEYFTQTTLHV